MSSDRVRFGELFCTPQRNGLTRPKKVRGSGVPMVNMGELFAHPRIRNLVMDRVPLADSEAAFLLAPGDLLFARQSLVLTGAGQCSVFLGNTEPTTFESHLIRCRLDPKRADPIFYFYFFRSPEGRRAIEAIVEQGAGASGIRGSDLVNVRVPCLPLNLQQAVGMVLSAIDDRIALLRETNATLEAIAQALFKSWFVDFDPVRAKSQGLAPAGMDEATAALFPDGLEESAAVRWPRSWRIGKVEDLLELAYGRALKATDRLPGDVPVYGSGGIAGNHNVALVDGPGVVVGRKGTIGSLYWEDRPFFPIDTVFFVRSRVPLAYCFHQLAVLGLRAMNTDGAVPGLNRNNVYRLHVVIPPPVVLDRFDAVVTALRSRISANHAQVETLKELRDTLLPRLISGQLRLPESEQAA